MHFNFPSNIKVCKYVQTLWINETCIFVYKRQLYQLITKVKVKPKKMCWHWITDWFATEDFIYKYRCMYSNNNITESHLKDPEFNSSLKT